MTDRRHCLVRNIFLSEAHVLRIVTYMCHFIDSIFSDNDKAPVQPIHGGPKMAQFLYALSSSNINRF